MPEENIYSSSKEGVNLTKSLIAQRNLFAPVQKEVPESISQALTSLLILRLDRERISCIPNLQGLEQIHSIYLQQNEIEKIENLSSFPNLKEFLYLWELAQMLSFTCYLQSCSFSIISSFSSLCKPSSNLWRFLSLAGNRISRVENLRALPKLQFLDLSHNHIESLDTDELPRSLLVLELTGNKCTNQNSYRESVLAALPHLIELDAQRVPSRKDREEVEDSSEGSDEDIPELSQPLSIEKDFFVDLHNEFTSRSERRRREVLSEHEAHLDELKDRQDLRHLLLNASPRGPNPPDPEPPTPEAPAPRTECHGAPGPSLEMARAVVHEGLSIPKGKAKVRNQGQVKALKGEVASMAKYVTKAKK